MDYAEILKGMLSAHGDLRDDDEEMMALSKGIEAIQNQPKYERALKLQAKEATCCNSYGDCNNCEQSAKEIEKCVKVSVDFFKKQAGLNVD